MDLGDAAVPAHCLLQDFAIAVIGEYVGKIYFEAKSRPRYIVEQEMGLASKALDARGGSEALQASANGYSRVTP